MRQDKFLKIAKEASSRSDHYKYKMGCAIAKGNKILGVGCNSMKTHPKSPHKFKSTHAEFMAAQNAGLWNLEGATVYVFREQKDGKMAMAKPCPYCWRFLVDCGVKEVVYSFEGSFKKESMR